MAELLFAGCLLVATHLGVSSTPLRAILVAKLGEKGYLGLYSVIALAAIVYLVSSYLDAPRWEYLWQPSTALHWAAFLLMPVAFVLMIGGFASQRRNPTSMGGEGGVTQEPTQFLRITRHPFQWSLVIWATVHIIANGDLASLIFFGSLGVLSLAGTFLIDRKKAVQLGNDWQGFAEKTSNVPFAAIAAGRNQLKVGELWLPIVIGLVVFALVLVFHRHIAGIAVI